MRVDNKGEKKTPPYKPRKISLPKSPPLPTLPNNRLAGNPGTPSRKRWEKEEEKTPSRERREKKKKTSSVPVIPECLYQESKSEEKNLRRERPPCFHCHLALPCIMGVYPVFRGVIKGFRPALGLESIFPPGPLFLQLAFPRGVTPVVKRSQ